MDNRFSTGKLCHCHGVRDEVITYRQALAAGMTPAAVRARLESGRWQRLHEGVYTTYSGPVPRQAWLWAAVLACGSGSTLSHNTAAELWGLSEVDDPIHVTVPSSRRVVKLDGIRRHYSRRIRNPVGQPPRTRIEPTIIDLATAAPSLDQALGWLTRGVGSRLTTPHRLAEEIASRPKLRWREDLTDAISDLESGTHSVLELRYLRNVERAHGLPRGERQVRFGNTRQDVAYAEYATVIELDGRAGHAASPFRDMRRDNNAAQSGLITLRYGWSDVFGSPCAVAGQVAAVLHLRGWTGVPARCGRRCLRP